MVNFLIVPVFLAGAYSDTRRVQISRARVKINDERQLTAVSIRAIFLGVRDIDKSTMPI